MTGPATLLGATDGPLRDAHDALLVDLDGVVQLGERPVPGAAEALATARGHGLRIAFVTNNAARTADDVVAHLKRLGVVADATEVVTSSMAAADLLAAELPPGTRVLVVGGAGLWAAVAAAGLTPIATTADDEPPAAVVQGWGPEVGWHDLAEATVALRAGARWVATNRDRTLPSARGPLPGAGALIAAVETAVGRGPDTVAGKPGPALFTSARDRTDSERPLMIGDRLDTDIAGARAAGIPSLLVLTGVASARDVLAAPAEQRPTYLGADLGALDLVHPEVRLGEGRASCAGVTVTDAAEVSGDLSADDGLHGLRAAAALAWAGTLPPDLYDVVLKSLGLD